MFFPKLQPLLLRFLLPSMNKTDVAELEYLNITHYLYKIWDILNCTQLNFFEYCHYNIVL